MSQATLKARGITGPLAFFKNFLPRFALRLLGLALVDALAIWLLYFLIRDGVWPLAIVLVIVTLIANVINLTDRLYPLRWMSPAFVIIILLVLYPILFTVYTAFTNYSDGHLLTKIQTIRRIGQDQFLPEGGETVQWTGYRSESGEIVLWLTGEKGQTYLAHPNEPLQEAVSGEDGIGPLDESGVPTSIEGYVRMEVRDILPILDSVLAPLEFGEPPLTYKIKSIKEAAQLQPRYVYDEAVDAMVDQIDGTVYYADEKQGFFTSEEGKSLNPGYQVVVGLANFERLLNSPALRGPFIQVFIWTIVFAFFSVLTTFALGLFMALVLDDPILPARKLIRTFLILPYAIPGVIGILIWRGMLNQHLGVLTTNMVNLFGWAPGWFTDSLWSKVGILLVNLWLGYPYMMLICSGALQAIPRDIYEAADVDGASTWQRFWGITLPLLLVSVGPLLIASFTFNFNNFTVIYAYNEGRPPIPGTPTPAGYTDILISYTYRLAFESGRGAEHSYAAAITIVIFLVVATITLFQYRFMGRWEEISESV
ncbi:MAG TPA: maltose ABC transporter permease MalF [Anaerolineae bacterium]|nr:maltose ABC transporter permease MalF [Anaerolineae bacterium]